MTEAEWLASTDPRAMIWWLRSLVNLRHKRNSRKLRLFAVACCHRIHHLLERPDAIRAVALAEQNADGLATEAEMLAASELVARIHDGVWDAYEAAWKASAKTPTYTFRQQYVDGPDYLAACAVWRSTLWEQIKIDPHSPHHERPNAAAVVAKAAERSIQADLLRDIFGNPCRPVSVDPASPAVQQLALAAYDQRQSPSGELDPARLAVLADALEEAGAAELVEHLRGVGPHVRGCWVVDLILGKQ